MIRWLQYGTHIKSANVPLAAIFSFTLVHTVIIKCFNNQSLFSSNKGTILLSRLGLFLHTQALYYSIFLQDAYGQVIRQLSLHAVVACYRCMHGHIIICIIQSACMGVCGPIYMRAQVTVLQSCSDYFDMTSKYRYCVRFYFFKLHVSIL